jgi:ribonucleoside-diphosphate reductase alpha chain
VVNKHLLHDLVEAWLVETETVNADGSFDTQDLKELYKTVWEMSMKDIIDMSQRGYFVDQSQSLNLFMQNANYANFNALYMHGNLS